MAKIYTFIDVFSGCGGLSHGLEKAGLKCLLGIDFSKDAIESFKLNHPHAQAFCGDIKELTNAKLSELTEKKKIDVVVGGPPCQGFSTVGRGEAEDPRNYLFLQFVRMVRFLSPKAILIENVTGLLASKNRHILKKIFAYFERQGFAMEARVLSAEEYGVPERRRRAIIVGVKDGFHFKYPRPSHGPRGKRPFSTVGDALKTIHSSASHHGLEAAQISGPIDKQRLAHIPEGRGVRYRRDEEKYLPTDLRFNVVWEDLPENRFRQTKLQRLDRNRPSFTILTSRTSYYHPVENRYLTAREAAAIQSFPSEFEFFGSASSAFRQIGNAVPVDLAHALGKALIRTLRGKNKTAKTLKKAQDFKKYAFHYNREVAI